MHQAGIALFLVASAIAQDTAYTATYAASSITSSASLTETTSASYVSNTKGPTTHIIEAGKGGHTFSPDIVLAEVGDTIEWQFYPTNHSVIRAAYEYPCVPYEMIMGVGSRGFWSGWEPVDAVLENPPTYSVVVNDTDPIFYYCGAPGSCTTSQMVGVINPNASTSLSRQKQLASDSRFILVPGENWPDEESIPSGISTTSTATATTIVTSTSTSAPAATSTAATASSSSHASLGIGAIAGIAIGGAAVLLMAGMAVWYCGRKSHRSRNSIVPGAPAQETNAGFPPNDPSQAYAKTAHMSMISGYGMPPNYEPGIRSPGLSATPVDPMMGQQQPLVVPHMGLSPNVAPASPVYGHASSLPPGPQYAGPVEMSGETSSAGVMPRLSTDKPGVERYT